MQDYIRDDLSAASEIPAPGFQGAQLSVSGFLLINEASGRLAIALGAAGLLVIRFGTFGQ